MNDLPAATTEIAPLAAPFVPVFALIGAFLLGMIFGWFIRSWMIRSHDHHVRSVVKAEDRGRMYIIVVSMIVISIMNLAPIFKDTYTVPLIPNLIFGAIIGTAMKIDVVQLFRIFYSNNGKRRRK